MGGKCGGLDVWVGGVRWVGRAAMISAIVFLVLALALPLAVTNTYYLHVFVALFINIVLAGSLNFILGYVGEKSLGHAAFFGIGAYVSAILVVRYGTPVWLGMLAAAAVAGVVGVAIGYPSLRLRGPYFAIVTLGFGAILQLVATNWVGMTKGPMGIPGVPPLALPVPGVGEYVFRSEQPYYYAGLLLVVATLFLTWRIQNSRTGRAFVAIRENFDLAESVGINTFRYKMIAFVLGTVMAGFIGAFYGHYANFVSPKALDTAVTLNVVTMVIIGGEGTVIGPVLGALVMTFLPEVLRVAEHMRMVIFALILLFTIIYAPAGITGMVRGLMQAKRTKKEADAVARPVA